MRTFARLVVAGATLFSIGCAASPTAPVVTRSVQSTQTAAHDDTETPPEGYCASGWTQTDGRWVCEP
jgi:hypothetical protein